MTSNDKQEFITVEVFNARMDRLEAITEKNVAIMQKENAEFRIKLMENLSNEFNKLHAEIAQLHTEIGQLDKKIEVQTARIDSLFHWNYWIIAFIVALFITPSVIEGIKNFSRALTDGIIKIFKSKVKN